MWEINHFVLFLSLLTFLLGACSAFFYGKKSLHAVRITLAIREQQLQSLQQQQTKDDQLIHEQSDQIRLLQETCTKEKILREQQQQNMTEKINLMNDLKNQHELAFAQLANQLLDEKGKKFTEQNQQNITQLLSPLREQLIHFTQMITHSYDKESKERVSLSAEIHHLKQLNQQISQDAIQLTNALKGEVKTQGIWGEMILERLLESSGLCKGREYEVQVNLKNEQGQHLQPDVIVHLPEDKDIIIDAKVSLGAYERYCAATTTHAQASALQDHTASIRQHIRRLGRKDYQKLVTGRCLDFILLFLPIEGALSLALEHDQRLLTEALDKHIVLTTPCTLLVTLRTIHNLWRIDAQNRNAQDIARQAGFLYDKFVGFVNDLMDVDKKLDVTKDTMTQALKKLSRGRGNLVTRSEKLKAMGAQVSKSLPEALIEDNESELN